MSFFKLIITVVPHNKGDICTMAARNAGAGGGTVLMGRHLGSSNLKAVFGLGEASKDVILTIVDDSNINDVKSSLENTAAPYKKGWGTMFTVNLDSVFKNGQVRNGDKTMENTNSNSLIAVILNKGYADDVMAKARSAGAGGGTVINARGTAREEDSTFFGVHIVPEKEMLLIIVDEQKKMAVLDAVKSLRCLNEKGSGIAFCTGVEDFTVLGN